MILWTRGKCVDSVYIKVALIHTSKGLLPASYGTKERCNHQLVAHQGLSSMYIIADIGRPGGQLCAFHS